MIDIHNHILPGLDDGAASLDEALAMARIAAGEGITDIIATPHHANGRYTNEAVQVLEAVGILNETIAAAGIPVRLHPGQEVRAYKELMDDYYEGRLLSLANSRYLLLELPTSRIPDDLYDLIHELGIAGITPVIAHPERNMELSNHPDKLAGLIERGALAQMTTHSINGLFGRKIQDVSFTMCESHLIHFLSSDAHNPELRPFGMTEANQLIKERLGQAFTDYYIHNAQLLLENQMIEFRTPNIRRKKRFLFW